MEETTIGAVLFDGIEEIRISTNCMTHSIQLWSAALWADKSSGKGDQCTCSVAVCRYPLKIGAYAE